MKITDSERLAYSIMTRDDAEIMFQIDQDPEVMRYLNGGKMTTREDVQNIYIPRMEKYTDVEKGWGLWKVTSLKDKQVIGFILVRPMNFFTDSPEFRNIELGWRFIQKSWGFGYATESANAVLHAMIELGDVDSFTAIAVEENLASISIMKKLGMKYIKTYKHKDSSLDDINDTEVVYYQMLVNKN